MRTRTGPNGSADRHVKEIKRKTRRKFSAEEKIRIVLDGLRIELGFAEFFGLGEPSDGPEKHEMVGQVGVGACDHIARCEVLSFDLLAIGGEDKANLVALGLGGFAVFEGGQGFRHSAWGKDFDVDRARLQDAVNVGFV